MNSKLFLEIFHNRDTNFTNPHTNRYLWSCLGERSFCDPSGNVRGLARLRYFTTGQFGVISVAGFRNGNNAVTISLTQLDEVAVREQRRVARYVPANDHRRDSSTRSNAALPPDICALPIALSLRGKPIPP